MKAHQDALVALRVWDEEWAAAVGAADKEESFRGKWHRLKNIPAQRAELAQLRERRVQQATSILATLHRRSDVLKSLFAPVQALVDDEPHIREALGVQFSVHFSFDAFVTRLFDFIKQNAGSFVGHEESKALASKLLAAHDLTTNEGLAAFLADVGRCIDICCPFRSAPGRLSSRTILKADRTARAALRLSLWARVRKSQLRLNAGKRRAREAVAWPARRAATHLLPARRPVTAYPSFSTSPRRTWTTRLSTTYWLASLRGLSSIARS